MSGLNIAYRPTIFTFHVCGDGMEVYISRERVAKNQFHILYPSTYIDNMELYNKFLAENSLLGDDNWSAEKALRRAKVLFKVIQQNSQEVVSPNGDASILHYDDHSKEFTASIISFNDI